jgi:hypothetical protein
LEIAWLMVESRRCDAAADDDDDDDNDDDAGGVLQEFLDAGRA